ncbi:hypothetical protein SRABI106_03473 [Rahnella aquatilis]|nr:hypothetical protein SRABI106_03473 [Rahnella aquatilis]
MFLGFGFFVVAVLAFLCGSDIHIPPGVQGQVAGGLYLRGLCRNVTPGGNADASAAHHCCPFLPHIFTDTHAFAAVGFAVGAGLLRVQVDVATGAE